MLSSLIHTGTGSFSKYKLNVLRSVRLIQFLFGYHYLISSLMERRGLTVAPVFQPRTTEESHARVLCRQYQSKES